MTKQSGEKPKLMCFHAFYEELFESSKQAGICAELIFGCGGILNSAHEGHAGVQSTRHITFLENALHIIARLGSCPIKYRPFWNARFYKLTKYVALTHEGSGLKQTIPFCWVQHCSFPAVFLKNISPVIRKRISIKSAYALSIQLSSKEITYLRLLDLS